MTFICAQPDRQQSKERGSIIIMTAIFMLLLFLMLGLCIDVSRIYMVRAELQNGADAAALSAARELNAGTLGIDYAVTRANSIINTQGFAAKGVTISKIEFATALVVDVNTDVDTTAWLSAADAKADATVGQIKFVRVTTGTESTAILFGLAALGSSHEENRNAVAGMSVGLTGVCDYFNIAVGRPEFNLDTGTRRYSFPTGVPLRLNFVSSDTANKITLNNMDYTVLDTSWVTGGGSNEVREAIAGVTPRCRQLNEVINFEDSNSQNNPSHIEDGANVRFDIYNNGLKYDPVLFDKPDLNIYGKNYESITLTQYRKGSPTASPSVAHPGKPDRRMLLVPVVDPIPPGGEPRGAVKAFRAFFLKQAVDGGCKTKSKPCPPNALLDGDLIVEYAGDDFVIGRGLFDPTSCSSNLGLAVLYR